MSWHHNISTLALAGYWAGLSTRVTVGHIIGNNRVTYLVFPNDAIIFVELSEVLVLAL